MSLYSSKTKIYTNVLEELTQCIDVFVINKELKNELHLYVKIHFTDKSNITYTTRLMSHTVGIFAMILSLKNKKISDLDWKLLCKLHNINVYELVDLCEIYNLEKTLGSYLYHSIEEFKNNKTASGWLVFYNILNAFYLFLHNGPKSNLYKNIDEIRKYKHLLITTRRLYYWQNNRCINYNILEKKNFNNYPFESEYQFVLQLEYSSNIDNKQHIAKLNFNCNTSNELIKTLMFEFFLSFNKANIVIVLGSGVKSEA